MKKILLLVCVLVFSLVGCTKKYQKDPYSDYRKYTAAVLFDKARDRIRSGKYDDAVTALEAMDTMYPFGPYAKRGQMMLIYAYYMDDNATSTIVAADRYVHLYPRSKHTDYAYYMRGLASFKVGMSWLQKKLRVNLADRDADNLRQAFIAFSTLVQRYPQSRYVANAHQYLIKIRNMIAEHQMHVADFYMRHKAYVAAANRATILVEHFEGTVFVPKALALMVKAYRAMHLPKMAAKSLYLLAHNYPKSKAYKTVNK